jgi:hypothetical protein
LILYAVIDERSSPDHPLGDSIEVFVLRENAERFIEEVRGDDPEAGEPSADRGARAAGGRAELKQPKLKTCAAGAGASKR